MSQQGLLTVDKNREGRWSGVYFGKACRNRISIARVDQDVITIIQLACVDQIICNLH